MNITARITATVAATVAAADVAVVPSIYEPFGFVALEAMALGSPLVAARTGGLAEIVEEGRTGWLFTPGDPSSLAAVVGEVLAHPREARARVAAARGALDDRFGWSMIADRTDSVYRSVAGGEVRAEGPARRAGRRRVG